MSLPSLPIDSVLPELRSVLHEGNAAVLVAPPGAGKTTRIPLTLLDEEWAKGKRIILLEPRRLAARSAAAHMAQLLGEKIGETVGLRVRFGSQISPRTRLEVVTEGVFSRMILDDPLLEGVGAVLFDEFHERSLDADFGLALALDVQNGLRNDLKIMVMSATLDGNRIAELIRAPLLEAQGHSFPVTTFYLGRDPLQSIETEISRAVFKALREETGSILAFLPGQKEISQVARLLAEQIRQPSEVMICPLYGALSIEEQDKAILPAPAGKRKIVLATSIAETSLTIEGIRVVIDSGLARVPEYEPALGLTRLKTVKISRAGAEQRRGRAGRVEPGICYRLWEEAANNSLPPFMSPEILTSDLSSLMLDCAAWGVKDPASLLFPDTPPEAALREARTILKSLKALDDDGAITSTGHSLRSLALPVRLARMVLEGARQGFACESTELAVLLVERGLGGSSVDLAERVRIFRKDRSSRAEAARKLARSWTKTAQQDFMQKSADNQAEWGLLLAAAYPDRIARQKGQDGNYLMANGRAGKLDPADPLSGEKYLVIADIQGKAASGRISAASALPEALLAEAAGSALEEREEIIFDHTAKALKRRLIRSIGALIVEEYPLPVKAGEETTRLLTDAIRSSKMDYLPWGDKTRQLRQRLAFMRCYDTENMSSWPDMSANSLLDHLEEWLAPFLTGITALEEISEDNLKQALLSLIPWDQQKRLDNEAPSHFNVPSGSHILLDYSEEEPALHVRVQELFGLSDHPALCNGRVPIVLHLLSPAQRVIQITRDLPGFWKGSWNAVKAELKGRYPKHFWPDDPVQAIPTRKTKKAFAKTTSLS